MNVLNGKISLTLRLGAMVAALLLGQQAMAIGTAAGTEVRNTANVDYEVGGVPQDDIDSNEVFFVVDRRVDFTLLPVSTPGQEGVSPGENNAFVDFVLVNTSNSELDFSFAAVIADDGSDVDGATDTVDENMANIGYDVFTDISSPPASRGDGTTYADELAADGTVYIRVWGDAALTLANGAIAGVELTATAADPGAIGTEGGAIDFTETATDTGVESVAGDADNDGVEVSIDGFVVNAAVISVDKDYAVIDDGFGGTDNPIPGATVEYTITVSNASTLAPATAVVITDVLDSDVDFVPGSILVNGAACAAGDTCTFSDPNISASGPSFIVPVAVGVTPGELVLTFQVTINGTDPTP